MEHATSTPQAPQAHGRSARSTVSARGGLCEESANRRCISPHLASSRPISPCLAFVAALSAPGRICAHIARDSSCVRCEKAGIGQAQVRFARLAFTRGGCRRRGPGMRRPHPRRARKAAGDIAGGGEWAALSGRRQRSRKRRCGGPRPLQQCPLSPPLSPRTLLCPSPPRGCSSRLGDYACGPAASE